MVIWKYIKNMLGIILIIVGFYLTFIVSHTGIWGVLIFLTGLGMIGGTKNEK